MMLTYHNLNIEIQTEGIISIASLHIMQRLNEHGKAMIKAVVEEEKAMEMVEQAVSSLSVRISRRDAKKQTVFCGRIEEIRTEKENGLFYLYMDFSGYTREWDLTDKSQSYCKGNDTYEQVLNKALSEYEKAQIRDEATGGARIPGILMQYEETDWTFLKRLASHFSTFVLADNTAEYGKAYFGIPHMDYGTVLCEEEYTLLKGKERYEKLEDTGDLMPQEMMSWRLKSLKHMQFGEQVMLGYIETVVTAVDIRTEMEDLVYEYELSRRKGILTSRKTNPKIYGMSIPATVKERKGNQVRVQLDIDPSYEPSGDLKWFTYAIETSNFYCMPEERSRVHIYFPSHEEQSAMAVHALRMGGSSGAGAGSGGNGGASGGSQSGGGGSTYGGSSGSTESSGSSGGGAGSGGSAPTGGGTGGGGMPAGSAAMTAATAAEAEKKEQPEEEKDPDYKVFSDPSGSCLELAPYGITFSPGNGSTAMMLQKTGSLSLSGLHINFFSDKSNILVGTGKKGNVETVYVEAEESLQMSLKGGDSQITMNEETNIIATFVRKDAELKNPAQPLASEVRSSLTATDAKDRADANAQSKDGLMEQAEKMKEELLAEKEKEAQSKIRSGILSILTVVATVAVVVATGGAALPLAIAIGATATFKTASAVADIAEGVSDLNKVKNGDISQSYNFMRDGLFGGNESLYEGAKAINDMVFGFVTGKAIAGNLAKIENANKVVKTINSANKFLENNKGYKYALNIGQDVISGCVNDYVQTGTINPLNVAANVVSGTLKGFGMSNLRFNCGSKLFNNNFVRKTVNVAMQTTFATGIDYVGSLITGEPFDLSASVTQNMFVSALGEVFAEPVDAATGAFMMTTADMLLPDIADSIRLERSYRSTSRRNGWIGRGWRFSYESRIYRDKDIFHVQLPMGYVAAFTQSGEKFIDTIGNGRFMLRVDTMAGRWHVTDRHQHKNYCYNEKGLLESVSDKNGQNLYFTYQGEYPETMVTPLGRVLSFVFDEGKLVKMSDDTGRSIGYRYEGGLLTEVVHMDGGVTRYAYSEEGYLIRPTDQTGLSYLTNEYDEKGRVVLQTLANGDIYRAAYCDRERKVRVEYSTYPGWKEYRYDERMAIRGIIYPDGSRKFYNYDERGNRVLETDQLGRNTRWEYDAWGHLVKEAKPEGLETEYLYDEAGDLVCVRDNGGREKLLAYDACHNLIQRKIKTEEGHFQEQSYAYDAKGRLIKETDGEGHETCYHYKEDCVYPSLTTYSDGTELKCEYSRNGRRLSEDDGAVRWEYAYNQGGWRTLERDGEGNETHYLYDGMGRKLSMYTPMQWKGIDGKRTDYKYDFLERIIDTAYPDGSHERLLRDGEGNILKKVHPNAYEERTKDGEGTCYDYDGENRLLRIHYPDGGVERFFYDGAGNRIKHVLPEQYDAGTDDGEGWSYTYDAGNRLTSVTGPDGVLENTYRYDLWGNCVQKTDEKGCSAYYIYDLKGRLTKELVPVGEDSYRKTTYEYDDNGNRIKEIRHGGSYGAEGELLEAGEDLILDFAYDAKNRLVRVEDGTGARISYQYDARGNRTYEEQVIRSGEEPSENGGKMRPVLKKIRYSYDRAGRLVKKSELIDDGLTENTVNAAKAFMTAVTSYGYDANGNRTSIITPEGNHISRSYDDRDRLVTERVEDKKNDIDRTTCISYDKAGNLVSVRQSGRDGQAREIAYDYDLKDRLTHMEELDGPVLELIYDKNDRRTEQKQLLPVDGERYEKTEFRYDVRGNLLERYGNDILLEQNTYDIRGRRLTNADGDGVETESGYGLQGEQLETFTVNSRKQGKPAQRLVYDARGRITGIEDGLGGRTSYQLDAWGKITGINNAEGGQEKYAYDQAGNLTETVDARGGKIQYAYNSQGKVCAITDQLGNTETFRYDREGRQTEHTDRKGILTETKYNIYSQPVLQVCTDKKGKRQVMGTWEYDDLGQLKKSVAGGFSYTYLYRPDGKLLKKWSSGRQVIACDYYKNGILKSLTDVSGKTLHYGYNEAGRLSSLTDDEGKVLTEYAYTAAGRLKEIRMPEGLNASYEYDEDGNLSHLRIGNEEKGSLLYDAFMLYDLNGNRTGKTGNRLGVDGMLQKMDTAYSYDSMNRLTEERRITDCDRYAYDLVGNRIKKQHYNNVLDNVIGAINHAGNSSIINTANDCVIDGEETYCYNEKNELTEKKTLLAVTEYLYDENGSLVSEKEGEKTASYQYDLLNRQSHVRMSDGKKQENLYDGEGLRAGINESGKASTFIFHNEEILAECDGDSMPVRRHLSGLGLSCVQTLNDSSYHAYHRDEQGSTVYITGSNGAIENCYFYDAFGNVLESRGNVENRILYTGQQYDQEIGQYYLRARYYNPLVGRFTQEDTYRGDGLNLYTYCGNNPVMYYDPNGYAGIGNCPAPNQAESEEQKVADQAKSDKQKLADQAAQDYNAKYNPVERAESKGYTGVKETPNGGASFQGTEYMYNIDGQETVVKIEATGSRSGDFNAANLEAGLKETPDEYVWHHLDDYNVADNTFTLELVQKDAHNATKPHSGGCAQYDAVHGASYNPAKK